MGEVGTIYTCKTVTTGLKLWKRRRLSYPMDTILVFNHCRVGEFQFTYLCPLCKPERKKRHSTLQFFY